MNNSDFLIKRKVDMPAKKSKKTQSQTSKKKTVGKKTENKQIPLEKNSKVKKTTRSEQLSASANFKKVLSNKGNQFFEQKAAVTKDAQFKKFLWPIIILLLVLGIWFFRDQVIVAMVNGKPITRLQIIKELEKQGASQILESLITMELVNQAIKDAGIEVDEAAVDNQLVEIEESLSAQGQNLDDLLEMQNLSKDDVREDIRLNLQVDSLLADKIEVSQEEVMEYFETNKEFLGEEADFEEMKEDIEAQVVQEKRAEAQQEWLETLRSEANIRYLRFEPANLF